MSRELGVSSYEGDITEEATEPLLIELMQDSRGMGRIRHLCRGWHGASLDVGKRGQGESQRLTELRSGASEAREKNGGQLEAGQNLLEGKYLRSQKSWLTLSHPESNQCPRPVCLTSGPEEARDTSGHSDGQVVMTSRLTVSSRRGRLATPSHFSVLDKMAALLASYFRSTFS